MVFSFVVNLLFQVSASGFGIYDWPRSLADEMRALVWSLSEGAPIYGVIVFVHHAGHYLRQYEASAAKAADLNAQLAQAQLQNLKMQLQPHFLFNSLHSVSELIHTDPHAAERMVVRLSQLLRSALASSSTLEVPLEHEIEITRLYLDIEKMRFEERLAVEMQVSESLSKALVPSFILQPLVENSIKHGIRARPGAGYIRVEACLDGGYLVLTVRDNGTEFLTMAGPVVEGVGLRTTRARLEKLYGSKQDFRLIKRPQCTEAVIRLPFRLEGGVSRHEHAASTGG